MKSHTLGSQPLPFVPQTHSLHLENLATLQWGMCRIVNGHSFAVYMASIYRFKIYTIRRGFFLHWFVFCFGCRRMATLSSMAGSQSGLLNPMAVKMHTVLLCRKIATLSCTQRLTTLVGTLLLMLHAHANRTVCFCVTMVSWWLTTME